MNKNIAVFFGGKSYEHDISILTGLQVLQAIDITKYNPIPVYIDIEGSWWTSKELLNINNYPITNTKKKNLKQITINIGDKNNSPRFKILNKRLFENSFINFDIAFFAFHGNYGETGAMQGLMETCNIPYTGADILSSALYMSKIKTKYICRNLNIKVLDEIVIKKPITDDFIDIDEVTKNLKIKFPVCLKPANLGSSVGVHKATNKEELNSAILSIFKLDTEIIIEPFVENLKEYNIAIIKNKDGKLITSAIESPINKNEFLSFKDKYLKKDGIKKVPCKRIIPNTETLSSGREYNPNLTKQQENFIINSTTKLFDFMGATGSPRIDFLSNSKTGEIWLNEVNPIPGSLAFYLWENSTHKINYTKLIDIIIENGFKTFETKKSSINLEISASKVF